MKKLILVMMIMGVQNAYALPSLEEALSSAIQEADTDKANSDVTFTLEVKEKRAAWNKSEEQTVVLEATGLVDTFENTSNVAVGSYSDEDSSSPSIHDEDSLQQELSDI